MKTWLGFSGILGIILFLFGVIGGLLLNGFKQPLIVSEIALGCVLIVVWFLTVGVRNIKEAGDVLKGRTARYGYNAVLYSLVFVALLVLVNWFVNRYDQRWDVTEQGAYSLAGQSVRVLEKLEQKLKLVALVGVGGNDDQVKSQLELYKHHNRDKVSIDYLNPQSKPHLIERYGVKPGNLLYLQYGDDDATAAVSRINENSEQAITNAILKLVGGAAKKVYFVQGHAEPDLESQAPGGLKQFALALEDENIKYEGLVLGQQEQVPADAAAVMLVSPKKPLLDEEKDMLIDYVEQGGRLFLFADPRGTGDVKEIAQHFGIEVGNDVIIDLVQRLFAAPVLGTQPVVTEYAAHQITKGLTPNDLSVFNIASSVKTSIHKLQGATYTDLLKSSATAWAERDLKAIFESDSPQATLDPNTDIPGPVTLATAYEQKIEAKKESKQTEESTQDAQKSSTESKSDIEQVARVVVFGDGDWIMNGNLSVYSNRDLALNALNWLVGEEANITIRPRAVGASAAPMQEQTLIAILASSFLVPQLILVFGLFVWWRRRSAVA